MDPRGMNPFRRAALIRIVIYRKWVNQGPCDSFWNVLFQEFTGPML